MAGKKSGGGLARNFLTLLVTAPLVFLFLPTVIFLGISLFPSFVALLVDRSPRRYGAITVGGMNFAGVFPYLLDLWIGEHSVPHGLTILQDPLALMVIFGSAGLGWMLFAGTPVIVASYLGMTSSRRLGNLRSKQKQLIDDWGAEVARAEDLVDFAPGEGLEEE